MNHKIIGSTWRCGMIGIVAVEYHDDGYWQAYIGIQKGYMSEEEGIKYISEIGDKLSWQEAQAFFPNFDITMYKTYKK